MRRYKQTLLSSTMGYRPSIRLGKHGHPMKAPEGEHGGGESGGQQQQTGGNSGGNNSGGNSGGEGGSGGNQNNSGNGFDAASFWQEPSPEGGQSPNSGSAGGNQSGGGQQQQQPQNEGNAFAERLGNLKFGTDVFNPDAIKAMNEGGDTKPFNESMTQFGRQAVRESVVMAAQLMQRNNTMIEARMKEMMDERFGQRDSEAGLGQEFPSYNKPGMKPMIDGIFAQAMRLSKGDRTGAIAMTKEMLKHTTQTMSSDLGLGTPPGGAGDGLGTQTNWEEELLGR